MKYQEKIIHILIGIHRCGLKAYNISFPHVEKPTIKTLVHHYNQLPMCGYSALDEKEFPLTTLQTLINRGWLE